jgi:hypothetical protein
MDVKGKKEVRLPVTQGVLPGVGTGERGVLTIVFPSV